MFTVLIALEGFRKKNGFDILTSLSNLPSQLTRKVRSGSERQKACGNISDKFSCKASVSISSFSD